MRPAVSSLMIGALLLGTLAADASAGNLRIKETLRGTLAGPEAVNAHTIDLSAGDRLVVRLRGTRRMLAPGLEVVGPDQAAIAAGAGGRAVRAAARARVSGTHLVLVHGIPGASLDYVLKLRGRRGAPYAGPSPIPEPPSEPPSPAPGRGTSGRMPRRGPSPGQVIGNEPPGQVPAHSVSHEYLAAALLRLEPGEDLEMARGMIDGYEQAAAEVAVARLQEALSDALLGRIQEALADQGIAGVPIGRVGLERVLALVEADRRSTAAAQRHAKLVEEVGGTSLMGDGALTEAMSSALAALERMRAAIEAEVRGGGLAALAAGDLLPLQPGLDVPPAPATPAHLAGMAALEDALGARLLMKARAGEREVLDLARALYETYARMLAEGDPGAMQIRDAVETTLRDLRAMEEALHAR